MRRILCLLLACVAAPALAQQDDSGVAPGEQAVAELIDLDTLLSDPVSLARLRAALLPPGAVVPFDHPDGCPEGWSRFAAATDRVIIGEGGQHQLLYRAGEPVYPIGGAATATLEVEHMPAHSHPVVDPGHTHRALAPPHSANSASSQGYPARDRHYRFRTSDRAGGAYRDQRMRGDAITTNRTGISLDETGGGAAFDIMPPFLALYMCRKD